ncbi:uncharacterized protein LOC107218419 [Neodiprion lecontei]|uniref:Uncharacterized protein LOC107218419 n=1 Tax=Neodiprion lecontei TaxID=441921 RepID=A0A6J0BDJ4_NEOLC|nr:uncharacterized protein LOC107218419 [Neodiprion lecontei]XP_046586563.1 uncharacterized protein LOC107218419 [Neodiprion lecontei]
MADWTQLNGQTDTISYDSSNDNGIPNAKNHLEASINGDYRSQVAKYNGNVKASSEPSEVDHEKEDENDPAYRDAGDNHLAAILNEKPFENEGVRYSFENGVTSDSECEGILDQNDVKLEELGGIIREEARLELAQNSSKRPNSLFKDEVFSPRHQSLDEAARICNDKSRSYLDSGAVTRRRAGSAEKLVNRKSPRDDKQVHHVQFNKDSKQCSEDPHPSPSASISTSSSSSSEDNSSLAQFSEARPPDGGWGWVVVAASFVVNLIADGITFSFGVIYVEFLNYFEEGKSKTAWIGSLFMAMPLLSGPIASFLTDRYGCRRVSIAGSVLATSGFVISSFTNSMGLLIFTFGVIAGFGLSLCYVAAVVIVAYYFDKRRSFATGLSVCGSGIGTFIFAPLTQYLLVEYGWRGTTLILAGLFFNLAVCGCLMRDLEWTTTRAKAKTAERRKNRERKRSKIQSSSADSFSGSSSAKPNNNQTSHDLKRNFASASAVGISIDNERDDAHGRRFSSLVTLPTFVKNGEKVPLEVLELLSTHKNVYNVILQNYPSLLISSRSFSDSGRLHEQIDTVPSERFVAGSNEQMDSKDSETAKSTGVLHVHHDQVTENSKPARDQETTANQDQRHHLDAAYLWWLKKTHPDCPFQRAAMLDHTASRRLPTAYFKDIRVHRHSLTYRGAMLNIKRYRLRASSCPDIYRNSMTTIAKTKMVWYAGLWEFWDLIVDMLDFSHFADPRFLLFAISNFLLYTWYDVPYVYLTDNAIEVGFSEKDASYLISVIGIVNMVGEIILGWAGDRAWVNASLVYAVCMGLCGAVTALIPLVVHNYYGLCAIAGAFGLFIAANYSLTSIILVELITLERFTNAYGLLLLVQGVANLIGPPLAGWLYDITGTYNLSFYLSGFFIALSGGLLVIVPLIEKYREWKAESWEEVTPEVTSQDFEKMNSV